MFLHHILALVICFGYASASCAVRSNGAGKEFCVCNETFCDQLNVLTNVSTKEAVVYETSKMGARFIASIVKFTASAEPGVPVLKINKSKIYQFILGFGGAFTDAAGINIKSASPKLQEKILSAYFTENGLQYNMGRVPIASCDFSTHPYSYDDTEDDFDLKNFQLTKEDFLYKIPFIQKASLMSKEELLLFGSPWSAPAWMKTNNAMNGKGSLKGEPGGKYYETWANYFVKFLEAYKQNNITFWGLTTQNEPSDGCIADFPFQAMCFPPEKQRDFLKLHLGPVLQKAGYGIDNLKLMILDDNRVFLPMWAEVVLQDSTAAQYVSGIAVHWYLGAISPYKLLNITHFKFPNVFFLATEACAGYLPWEKPKVDLGNWERAERYAHDIIEDLSNWSVGWIDWNLVLDSEGGPNWVKNFVDAPIIINVTVNEFYKQPMYYVLAHFSKCLPRGSFRIDIERPQNATTWMKNVYVAAFQTPKDKSVVIMLNRRDDDVKLVLYDALKGYLNINIHAHSVRSYVWLTVDVQCKGRCMLSEHSS